jgi:hypothetical protein
VQEEEKRRRCERRKSTVPCSAAAASDDLQPIQSSSTAAGTPASASPPDAPTSSRSDKGEEEGAGGLLGEPSDPEDVGLFEEERHAFGCRPPMICSPSSRLQLQQVLQLVHLPQTHPHPRAATTRGAGGLLGEPSDPEDVGLFEEERHAFGCRRKRSAGSAAHPVVFNCSRYSS